MAWVASFLAGEIKCLQQSGTSGTEWVQSAGGEAILLLCMTSYGEARCFGRKKCFCPLLPPAEAVSLPAGYSVSLFPGRM